MSIQDPQSTWIHASVDLAPDVTILRGTSLEGATSVASLVCKPPQRVCPSCTGGQICAVFCPECPAPLATTLQRR